MQRNSIFYIDTITTNSLVVGHYSQFSSNPTDFGNPSADRYNQPTDYHHYGFNEGEFWLFVTNPLVFC